MIFTYIIIMLVCFMASAAGAICGMGGGVIIKPVLDSISIMDIAAVSFLSGCTVLGMSAYSVTRNFVTKSIRVQLKTVIPITIGAILGGIVGKYLFNQLSGSLLSNFIGAVQSSCLLVLTFGTLVYTIKKKSINTKNCKSAYISIVTGAFLGIISSFLGIGGGPFNLVILSFLFSMEIKEAVQTSLFIILFSQISSLMVAVISNNIPSFHLTILIIMISMGIFGAIFGVKVNKKVNAETVNKLFIGMMIIIILICCYNIYHYSL